MIIVIIIVIILIISFININIVLRFLYHFSLFFLFHFIFPRIIIKISIESIGEDIRFFLYRPKRLFLAVRDFVRIAIAKCLPLTITDNCCNLWKVNKFQAIATFIVAVSERS